MPTYTERVKVSKMYAISSLFNVNSKLPSLCMSPKNAHANGKTQIYSSHSLDNHKITVIINFKSFTSAYLIQLPRPVDNVSSASGDASWDDDRAPHSTHGGAVGGLREAFISKKMPFQNSNVLGDNIVISSSRFACRTSRRSLLRFVRPWHQS